MRSIGVVVSVGGGGWDGFQRVERAQALGEEWEICQKGREMEVAELHQ